VTLAAFLFSTFETTTQLEVTLLGLCTFRTVHLSSGSMKLLDYFALGIPNS
jgi:hypothetical protein